MIAENTKVHIPTKKAVNSKARPARRHVSERICNITWW